MRIHTTTTRASETKKGSDQDAEAGAEETLQVIHWQRWKASRCWGPGKREWLLNGHRVSSEVSRNFWNQMAAHPVMRLVSFSRLLWPHKCILPQWEQCFKSENTVGPRGLLRAQLPLYGGCYMLTRGSQKPGTQGLEAAHSVSLPHNKQQWSVFLKLS